MGWPQLIRNGSTRAQRALCTYEVVKGCRWIEEGEIATFSTAGVGGCGVLVTGLRNKGAPVSQALV